MRGPCGIQMQPDTAHQDWLQVQGVSPVCVAHGHLDILCQDWLQVQGVLPV